MLFKIRLFFISIILAVTTVILLPFQMVITRIFPHHSHHIAKLWHQVVLSIIGIRLHITGQPVTNEPVLWAANHVSWSDIPVMGAILPAYFVAKKDMASWPVLGFLAKLQNTIFVDREARSTAIAQAEAVAQNLKKGHSVILFPEGTTTDGMTLYPFKSTLFGGVNMALKDSDTPIKSYKVQPVTLSYNKLYGIMLGRFGLPHVAWPGDIELMPHLTNMIKQGAFDIDVHFSEPIEVFVDTDRKQITRQVKQAIEQELVKGLRG